MADSRRTPAPASAPVVELRDMPLFQTSPVTVDLTPTRGPSTVPAPPVQAPGVPYPATGWAPAGSALAPVPPRRAGREVPAHRRTQHSEDAGGAEVNWVLVQELREKAAKLLAPDQDKVIQRTHSQSVIAQVIAEHVEVASTLGEHVPTAEEQEQLTTAIFDSLWRLGRWQPLVDNARIEDIHMIGYDQVRLDFADGQKVKGPNVAESDEDLIRTIAAFASNFSDGRRPFNKANPSVSLNLPGGWRLQADIAGRPIVTLRQHRLKSIDLGDLTAVVMIDVLMESMLRAAVQAAKCIVIAGPQNAGKTSFLRALANEIDPMEAIGTAETDYELLLHEMPDRHPFVKAFEAQPGGGERRADGTRAGEETVQDQVFKSLRHSLDRQLVGEVRGPEIEAMWSSMQAGVGSMSTVHANSASGVIERLVSLTMQGGPQFTAEYATRQVAHHIDLIVQIGIKQMADGRKYRYVREITGVSSNNDARGIAETTIFVPGPDDRGVPDGLPLFIEDLEAQGFDRRQFLACRGVGLWAPEPQTLPEAAR